MNDIDKKEGVAQQGVCRCSICEEKFVLGDICVYKDGQFFCFKHSAGIEMKDV